MNPRRRWWVGVWRRAYRLAIRSAPADARLDTADLLGCMEARLDAEARRRGGVGVGMFALGEIVDVLLATRRLRRERRSPAWRREPMLDTLRQDVRVAARGWLRRPGFAAVAMLTLGLGIGANTAMFSVADAVLFRPLPHRAPEDLVLVWTTLPGLDWRRAPISYPNYADWRAQVIVFDDLAAFTGAGAVAVEAGGLPERANRARVSGNLFGLLGNRALLGRTLLEADDAPGSAGVVLVSEEFWRNRLGGAADAVGRAIRIEGTPHVVVGVMPASFGMPRADLWLPLGPAVRDAERDLRFLQVIGRLGPGVAGEAAERDVSRVMGDLAAAYPEANTGIDVWLEPLHTFVVGDARGPLLVLLGAVGLLLVIACANLTNLLLARGAARSRELAVRAALGAGRRRIVRQLVTESAALALVGAAAGVLLAWLSRGVLLRLAPEALPRGDTIALNGRALFFTAAVALVSGVLVGLVPALQTAGPAAALRKGGRGATAGRSRHLLQRGLIVLQVALALVLLVGSGLLVNSLNRLLAVDTGLVPEGVLSVHVSLPDLRYPEPEDVAGFFDELLARVSALPGVERAGAVWALPFTNGYASGGAEPEGSTLREPPVVGLLPVRGDAFGALGMRVSSGRVYGPVDASPDARGAVVNETLARLFWPGEDAVGKRFRRRSGNDAEEEEDWYTVIGVVADARRQNLGEPPGPEIYFHHAQPEGGWASDMRLVVRTSGEAAALAAPVRRIIAEMDPQLATGSFDLLTDLIARSAAAPRIRTLLSTTFSVLAAVLAVIGIYGVMAFAVNERRREIGVRMALGARRGEVLAGVLREGATLVVLGTLLGLAAAAGTTRVLGSVLFGVSPLDVRTYALATALLACGALAACIIPAARAAKVDPLVALQAD